jgi:hypothetical protein
MNKQNEDEIIEMAIQAGLNFYVNDLTEKQYIEVIKHFAKLIEAKEREACAKICEEEQGYKTAFCALKIRARGQE